MSEQWQTVPGNSAPFVKFAKAGDSVKGKIIGKRQVAGLEGKTQDVVDLATPQGEYTVGLTSDLKNKVGKLEIGALVMITFTGTKKITGKPSPMKLFDVKTAAVTQ